MRQENLKLPRTGSTFSGMLYLLQSPTLLPNVAIRALPLNGKQARKTAPSSRPPHNLGYGNGHYVGWAWGAKNPWATDGYHI